LAVWGRTAAPVRANVYADPWLTFAPAFASISSPSAPATIVSPAIATEKPSASSEASSEAPSEALSLALSVQLSPARVNTYTAPLPLSSAGAPTTAVSPSTAIE
jgi:hypothetical protein